MNLRALGFILLICAAGTAAADDLLTFRSRDWIKPEFNDVGAEVKVVKLSPRIYALQFTFPDGLEPGNALAVFMRCLSRSIAAKQGYDGWKVSSADGGDGSRNIAGDKSLNVNLGLLKRGEKATVLGRTFLDGPIVYHDEEFRKACANLIRAEYMW